MEFDPFEGLGRCAWCDEDAFVDEFRAIGGGPNPVHICGICINKVATLYEPFSVAQVNR